MVIYQHGFMDSSAGICCDGLDSIAFQLADCGFDVWMNNTRGNIFSRHHKFIDIGNSLFWEFSFQ